MTKDMKYEFMIWDKIRRERIFEPEMSYDAIGGNGFWEFRSSEGTLPDIPESGEVYQYIGLKDHNQLKIYHGSVVKVDGRAGVYQVVYNPPKFQLMCISDIKPSCQVAGQCRQSTLKGTYSDFPDDMRRVELIAYSLEEMK